MDEINYKSLTPKFLNSEHESPMEGCFLFPNQKTNDSRGFFRKVFPLNDQPKDFSFPVCQVNLSSNKIAGTVRGLHYQIDPFLESKLISCTKGSVFDVLLDLRPNSKTYLKYAFFSLKPDSGSLLVPPQVAHGFQTLEDDTTLLYIHSNEYSPDNSRGINSLDPQLGISWPLPISAISEADRNLPFISEALF